MHRAGVEAEEDGVVAVGVVATATVEVAVGGAVSAVAVLGRTIAREGAIGDAAGEADFNTPINFR